MFLQSLACQRWQVTPAEVAIQDGRFTNRQTNETVTYAELATEEDSRQALDHAIPGDISVTPVQEWKVMGKSPARPGLRDYVTGAHKYPSRIWRRKVGCTARSCGRLRTAPR